MIVVLHYMIALVIVGEIILVGIKFKLEDRLGPVTLVVSYDTWQEMV